MLSTPVFEAASISITSGEWPAEISRQETHSLHGSPSRGFAQLIAFASSRAALVLPVPRGPQKR